MALAERWRRRIARAGVVLLTIAGVAFAADRLMPPDLDRLRDSSSLVLDRDGEVLRAFATDAGYWRLPATPDQVSPLFLRMLLAYEDQRFRWHPGVDPLAAVRALGQAVAHRRIVSGASTITMQTARLLEPRDRTLAAKLIEMARAVQLEAHFSKNEILSFYLKLAPYGGNLEGARAASLSWFGKEPRHLAPSEAALLVALPQSPEAFRPDRYPGRARAARDRVLDVMVERGVLTAEVAAEAKSDPVPNARQDMPFLAPHLSRYLAASPPAMPAHRTTIDRGFQGAVERLAAVQRPALGEGVTLAVLVVENAGRKVRAYVGSADFFDTASDGQVDMVRAVRSPGSTLKPFIYGMAFDDLLLHPETIVVDMPTRFGEYRPENFLRSYHGEVTVREALQQSLNVPAVATLEAVGPGRFDARLRAAGIAPRYGGSGGGPGLPLALGGVGLSLFDLVTLYAGLADGGTLQPLTLGSELEGKGGGVPLFGPAAAWYLTRILEGAPPPADFVDPDLLGKTRRTAYKTGTSYGYRDAWAIGYDDRYTVGVWVGRPDGAPNPDHFGRATAAPVLFQVLNLLPGAGRPANARRPATAIDTTNAGLPPRLRRFGPGQEGGVHDTLARALEPPLAITFPPDGAILDLDATATANASLPLTAEGGRKPLRWIVNGRPLSSPAHRRRADWRPDGLGYAEITVIDSEGHTARSQILLR